MHILMLSDVYFPRINGVSTSIQTFARSFLGLGHRVTLIAPEYPYEFEAGYEVIRIRARRLPFDPEDRLMSLKAIKRLAPGLKQREFDLIHIQTPFVAHYAGVYLARELGLKLVVSYHTFFEAYFEKYLPRMPNSWLRGIARRYSRKQCNQVDLVVSPSRPMLEKLREYGVHCDAEVIPTGLPPENFRRVEPNEFRHRHGIDEDAYLLLYVGRVAFEKNIEFLMEVFADVHARVEKAVLLVAGEGPALRSLKDKAVRMQLADQIRFLGYLDRDTELLECYQASDLFVFASETETQGLVLLEAMACELPVVSVASMGTLDVLVEGQGCVISPLDRNAFAQRVIALHQDPVRRRALARLGVGYARGWSSAAKAALMLDTYARLLGHAAAQVPASTLSVAEVPVE